MAPHLSSSALKTDLLFILCLLIQCHFKLYSQQLPELQTNFFNIFQQKFCFSAQGQIKYVSQ